MHTLFIAPTAYGIGLTSVSLGIIRALENVGLKVKLFKPVDQPRDPTNRPYKTQDIIAAISSSEPPATLTTEHVQSRLKDSNGEGLLLEEIVSMYESYREDADVVVVEGLAPSRYAAYVNSLNLKIVDALNAEVILVTSALHDSPTALMETLNVTAQNFGGSHKKSVLGFVINRVNQATYHDYSVQSNNERESLTLEMLTDLGSEEFRHFGSIPWESKMSTPRVNDLITMHDFNIETLIPGDIEDRRLHHVLLADSTAKNIVDELSPGTLIITAADRDDILMAATISTLKGVPLAGILLTQGSRPSDNIMSLCQPAFDKGLPLLSVKDTAFEIIRKFNNAPRAVSPDDIQRIEYVMDTIADHLDSTWLAAHCATEREALMSPPAFRHQLINRARKENRRIVLPEGEEPRTIQAAVICQERGIARCVLLGKAENINRIAETQGITIPTGLEILDPDTIRSQYIEPLVELRKHKGLSAPLAEAQLKENIVLGTMMLAQDDVDGLVSGAIDTTANTVRPAFQLIKTKPDCNVVSSIFFMMLPEQVFIYGDCAVMLAPNAEELAEVALQSAVSAEAFGITPKVAMISYSTGSSGKGTDVEKVREATRIAKLKRPDLLIDGPLQYDAAAIEAIGTQKAPGSPVAGRANVFIFPDLNTGNTTYKAVQRSADVISIGPMLQGLNKPVNDLSRGALIEDIVYTIALTAIQAGDSA
jgi:phosphate acetyltransferase